MFFIIVFISGSNDLIKLKIDKDELGFDMRLDVAYIQIQTGTQHI